MLRHCRTALENDLHWLAHVVLTMDLHFQGLQQTVEWVNGARVVFLLQHVLPLQPVSSCVLRVWRMLLCVELHLTRIPGCLVELPHWLFMLSVTYYVGRMRRNTNVAVLDIPSWSLLRFDDLMCSFD